MFKFISFICLLLITWTLCGDSILYAVNILWLNVSPYVYYIAPKLGIIVAFALIWYISELLLCFMNEVRK